MDLQIAYIESEIIDQYLHDDNPRPWIVGFSGGKDSTMLLQLVWNALQKVAPGLRTRPVYVVCNDTLVENPKVVEYVEVVLEKIQQAASQQGMPIYVHKTQPRLEDTFWLNLIGKGYPAPNNVFRWCTERLKINPTTRFIQEKVKESEGGEAIILLGTRSSESATRSRSLNRHKIQGKRLRRHILPNVWVYSPIVDVTTDEVWIYLLQNPSPWGYSNKQLQALYRNANGGDCPLVVDNTTPSCGNSRFGCWVCTVVNKDKAMEGLIEYGEEWMVPLLELRDFLAMSRNNEDMREDRGRDNKKRLGPYKAWVRAEILKRLLEAQYEIQQEQGDIQLISHQELVAIQISWYRDAIFQHKVSDIYNAIFPNHIDMRKHEEKFKQEEELLKKVCADTPEDIGLIQELLALEKTKMLLIKKRGLQQDINKRLDEFLKKDAQN